VERSTTLIAVSALAVVLVLSSPQSAIAATWIVYDNDTRGASSEDNCSGVRFSLPGGVTSAHLLAVRFQSNEVGDDVDVWVTGSDHFTPLVPVVHTHSLAPPAWLQLDVAGHPIVSGDFYVIVCAVGGGPPHYAVLDTSGFNYEGRSVSGTGLLDLTIPADSNFLIRAEIDPIGHVAVGGVLIHANKLAILAPYLALFGVIAAIISVVLVAPWKKPDD